MFEVEHSFSVMTTRFIYSPSKENSTNIISASADRNMMITNLEGQKKSIIDNADSYSAM